MQLSVPLFGSNSPSKYFPTEPSQPAAAGRLLSWALAPFSTSGIGGPLATGFPHPARFRPQGLITLSAAYSLRARAGFVSHRRRSWDSPFGAFSSHKVSRRFRPKGPTYRFARRSSCHQSSRPARRAAVSGLCPLRESLATGRGISTPIAGCSLGLHPSRVLRNSLDRDFARSPLTRFADGTRKTRPPTPQSFNRLLLRLIRPVRQAARGDKATLLGFDTGLIPDISTSC
jgi:hypothetical protein